MTIQKSNRMELLSQTYVEAVAAYIGSQVTNLKIDNQSVDGTFVASFGRSPKLDFQLKSTHSHAFSGDSLSYPLEIKNYNDLRKDRCSPIILVLLILPQSESDWLIHSEDSLKIQNCAYWTSVANFPNTENTSSVTVQFDKKNYLSPAKLQELLEMVDKGETP